MLLCLPCCFVLSYDEFTLSDCCSQVRPSPVQSGRSVLICGPELPAQLMPLSRIFSYIFVLFPFFPLVRVLLTDNIVVWRIEMKPFDVYEILEWVYCDSLYYGFNVVKFHCFNNCPLFFSWLSWIVITLWFFKMFQVDFDFWYLGW